ncbi:MAG: diaminopimelate epimerase [Actinomycetales bacterium]|nr:MAG: diaminopimelate epimerase [Actinomycetales bacterium]
MTADVGRHAPEAPDDPGAPTGLGFVKGHGTENDFVLVPDIHGQVTLTPDRVQRLCDRRAGIGGDGLIRIVPTRLADEPEIRVMAPRAAWFMDYHNADGSAAELCGNGTRVFAAYLVREGLEGEATFAIATRAGIKTVQVTPEGYAVSLGRARVDTTDNAVGPSGTTMVTIADGLELPGLRVDVGNPHTVVTLTPDLVLAGLDLSTTPQVTPEPPEGTNVEYVQVVGPSHIAMRVVERGVGETRSCGTGAVAAAAATRWRQGPTSTNATWTVDVPGGRLTVTFDGDQAQLAGPAELVADGTTGL